MRKEFIKNYFIDIDGNVYGPKSVIKQHIRRNYLSVSLRRTSQSKMTTFTIHRLLMENFKPVDGMEKLHVNHINGIKTDNRLENLEWCTCKENILHAYNVIKTNHSGSKSHKAKLTEKDVDLIRKLHKEQKLSKQKIANIIGNKVSRRAISYIVNNVNWKQYE